MTREGEAPAEPWRRQLGRSLALPLFFNSLDIAKMFGGVRGEAPAEPWRRKLGRSLALPMFFNRLGNAKMIAGVGYWRRR